MSRSFIIGLDEPIKTVDVVAEEFTLAPTFDNLMPVLEVDGVTLLGTTQAVTVNTYYEQILNRFKTMNIKGTQIPYSFTAKRED